MPERMSNPWRESLGNVRNHVMELLDEELAPGLRGEWGSTVAARLRKLFTAGGPPVDMEETDTEVVVTAEMPGLDPGDFTVELEGTRLILRGEKKVVRDESQQTWRLSERGYGAFHRDVALPCAVDSANVTATYRQGVLRVRLPKAAGAQAHVVQVNVE